MNPELEKRIYDAAPVLFQNRTRPCTETCMCWGIECEDGWFEPIYKLASAVEEINHMLLPHKVCVLADQVKQKYAGLCFYWHLSGTEDSSEVVGDDDETAHLCEIAQTMVDALVLQAEGECSRTCEICGKKGTFEDDMVVCGSWLMVKCVKCAQKRQGEAGIICDFREGFGFLSPFSDDGMILSVDGVKYKTFLGAYYGTLRKDCSNVFMNLRNPSDVQEVAIAMGIQEQSQRAVETMEKVLRIRYSGDGYKSTELASGLASVAGLEIRFYNHCHENFWGFCPCDECKDKEHLNHYGHILMRLSEEIRKREENKK